MASRDLATQGIAGSLAALQIDDPSKAANKDELMKTIQGFQHTRPEHITSKLGNSGEPITCVTNHISVNSATDWLLYQYQVEFSPSIDSKLIRTKILRSQSETIGMEDLIFDGAILFLPFRIPNCTLTSIHPNTKQPLQINVKLTNELPSNSPQAIGLLNLCLRRALQHLDFKQIGRYFYNPNMPVIVRKHQIEIWTGLISAIRLHEDKLLLCCELAHKILRIHSVLDIMTQVYRTHRDSFVARCTQLLVGTSVLARYSTKTYRIDDIDWEKTPEDQFESNDGSSVRFVDYYRLNYNQTITDLRQPLLVSRVKRRGLPVNGKEPPELIYLIPELCSATGLTDHMRNDRRVMQDLAIHTRVPPTDRLKHVQELATAINRNEYCRKMMRSWSLGFGTDPVPVQARVLPQEAIYQADDMRLSYDRTVGDWSRDACRYPVTDAKHLLNWVLVYPAKDRDKAEQFFKCIRTIGRQIGMQINEPYIIGLENDRVGTYLEAIKYGMAKVNNSNPDMVVSIVPNDNKTRYDAIKKLCCLDQPVPNQVVRYQTLTKNLMSVCGKVILQINCKLGGSLWRVQIPIKNAMVIGYDSYFDSSQRGKSAGAAVFSLNPEMTRWFSQCAPHTDTQALIGNLKLFCQITALQTASASSTNRTVFFPNVFFSFARAAATARSRSCSTTSCLRFRIAELGEKLALNYRPKLTFIIVNKRTTTRFFELKADHSVENPRPGTVVDSVVTRPERYDFYLVPQRVTQGTVTPVSYNVIFDNSGLQPDQMQRFAFKLCHLYYNWQGTVRIPAPCQYAHKLAFFVAQSLHQQAKDDLTDKLYFL